MYGGPAVRSAALEISGTGAFTERSLVLPDGLWAALRGLDLRTIPRSAPLDGMLPGLEGWLATEQVRDAVMALEHPDPTVTIEEVLWKNDKQEDLANGAKLKLADLTEYGAGQGWRGPGEYLLPLTRTPSGAYAVTIIPLSPGFNPKSMDYRKRIYPASAEALRQVEKMEPKKSQ